MRTRTDNSLIVRESSKVVDQFYENYSSAEAVVRHMRECPPVV